MRNFVLLLVNNSFVESRIANPRCYNALFLYKTLYALNFRYSVSGIDGRIG